MTTSPRWSGSENRHQQAYHRLERDLKSIECVALKCRGSMRVIGDGTRVECDTCKLVIKRPHSRI